MKRRDFLKNFATASSLASFTTGLPLSLLARIAQAQTNGATARNLVVIRLHGAFDSLQCLNPWTDALPDPRNLYVNYDPQRTGVAGDYQSVLRHVMGTQIHLGPSGHALAKYANKMVVINGICMGPVDLGHPFAAQYMVSGRTQERAPHLAAAVAGARSGADDFLVINGPIEPGEFHLKILQTVNLTKGLATGQSSAASFVSAYSQKNSHLEGHRSFSRRAQSVEQFNQILKDLTPANTERAQSSGGIEIPIQNFAETEADDIAAVAALATGLSTTVQLDWQQGDGGSPDSHALYKEQHPGAQRNRWDRLARFIERMERYALLDRTLVLVITEFSRTPALNSNSGKDHNYMDNSALLIGAGLHGGRVLGGHHSVGISSNRQEPALVGEFIDFDGGTGAIFKRPNNFKLADLPPGYSLIRPPDVIRTALEIVHPSLTNLLGQDARVLPQIVKIRS